VDEFVELLLHHGPLLVFAVTLLKRIGAPLPAGPMLVVAGGLGALGQMSVAITVALSLAANLLGDAVWFLGGRRYGYRVLRMLCRISLSPDTCVRQSEGMFERWAGWSLIAAKFVPGVSVVAAPMAGALKMSWRRFLGWDLAAAAVWTALYMAVGYVFRRQVREMLQLIADLGTRAAIALVVLAVLVLAWRLARRRRWSGGSEVERITPDELRTLIDAGMPPVIYDVRGSLARDATGMVPGAIPIDLDHLSTRTDDLPRDTHVVVYCNCPNDVSAVKAAGLLNKLGNHVEVLHGGHDAWSEMMAGRAPAAAA
jgi:membrane protein DedA with SNARE-associated domain/rhodanese-related sulfurtransferase